MFIDSNIRYLRKKAGISQEELAEKLGYRSFTTIQKWESGISTPPVDIFVRIASVFEVDMDDLARTDLSSAGCRAADANKTSLVPVYGKIPAGVSVEAVEDITGYEALSEEYTVSGKKFFSLRIEGDSMYPKYENGDVVLFEHISVCENGDDCAVRLRGQEATFKKIKKMDNSIILQPINPEYDPIQIDAADEDPGIEILGIAREIRRKV